MTNFLGYHKGLGGVWGFGPTRMTRLLS